MSNVNKRWVTSGIRILSARKHELSKMSKFSKDPKFLLYKTIGKCLNNVLNLSFIVVRKIKNSTNKTKLAWSIVKSIVS